MKFKHTSSIAGAALLLLNAPAASQVRTDFQFNGGEFSSSDADTDTTTSEIGPGPTLTGSNGVSTSTFSYFVRSNATNASTLEESITNGQYITFTLTVDNGPIDLGSFSLDHFMTGAAAASSFSYAVMSDATGFNPGDELGTYTVSGQTGTSAAVNSVFNLADSPSLQGLAAASIVEFRIYLYDSIDANNQIHRIDNIRVDSTVIEPLFSFTDTSPDTNLGFGNSFSLAAGETRTLEYEVVSPSGTGTVQVNSVILTDDADTPGAFTLGTITPALPVTLSAGETLSVEVTANPIAEGSFNGSLTIDTTSTGSIAADGNDIDLDISSRFIAIGSKINPNPTMETALTGWGGGSTLISPGLINGSNGMARVKGAGDFDLFNSPDSLYQATGVPDGASDFQFTAFFSPINADNFTDYASAGAAAGTRPNGDFGDRSFQWVLLSTDSSPPGGTYGDTQAANTIINLAYFPDGIVEDGTPDFYVYNSTTSAWEPTGIGAIEGSVDNDADGDVFNGIGDGLLDPATDPADVVNAYRLVVTGTGFGTPSATYDINIFKFSGPDTFTSGSATGLTAFHGQSGTTATPAAYAFTTADVSTSSNGSFGSTPPFWVDDVCLFNGAIPEPVLAFASTPGIVQITGPATTGSDSFTLRNDGLDEDVSISSITFAGANFSISSPTFPITLAPGESQDITINFDGSGLGDATVAFDTMTISSTDSQNPVQTFLAQAIITSANQQLANWNFEVPGTDNVSDLDTFAAWTFFGTAQSLTDVPGLVTGSTTAAYLDNPGAFVEMRQTLATPLEQFSLNAKFAIKDTTDRAFNLLLRGSGQANIRYQNGIVSAFSGGWQDIIDLSASPLLASTDADFNGSLNDAGDTKNVYQFIVTGTGWGTDFPLFSVAIRDQNGSTLGEATDLSFYQTFPSQPLSSIAFSNEFGNSPGFWIDDVVLSGSAEFDPDNKIIVSSITKDGTTTRATFTALGEVDVYRSTDLQNWTLTISEEVAGTDMIIDFEAPDEKAFYILVPTGDPAP